jgi:uncharacterized membrane protein YfcA
MPNETLDRAIRARTRHMWVAGPGIFVGGLLLYTLAQAMSREWAFIFGGLFVAFAIWAFREERALQKDVESALDESQRNR